MARKTDYDKSYESYRRQYEKTSEKGVPLDPMLSKEQYKYVYDDIKTHRARMGLKREQNMPRAIVDEQRQVTASQARYTRAYVKALQEEMIKKRKQGGELTPQEQEFLRQSTSYSNIYAHNKGLWESIKGFAAYFAQVDDDYYYI